MTSFMLPTCFPHSPPRSPTLISGLFVIMKFCQSTVIHALWGRRIWPRWREMNGRGIMDHSVKRTMRVNQKVWRSRLYCKSGDDQLRRTCAIQACSQMEIIPWPTRQYVMLTFTLSANGKKLECVSHCNKRMGTALRTMDNGERVNESDED